MTYHYKLCIWYRLSGVVNGVKHNEGDLLEMITTGPMKETLEEIKKLAKLDWIKEKYKDKDKRLQIFQDDELIYMYDSQYGEWKPKTESRLSKETVTSGT